MADVEVEQTNAVNANKSEEEEVFSSCEDLQAAEENETEKDSEKTTPEREDVNEVTEKSKGIENENENENEIEIENGNGNGNDNENENEKESENENEEEEPEVTTEKTEKALDDDQDRRNPQYIPKGGAFYEHDNRTSLDDVENEDPQDTDKKKKVWKESKASERWLHDCYDEKEQMPKTPQELIDTYGYDIRKEEAPPKARRRRKYGRGPDKYDRNWEDQEAYFAKQSTPGRRGPGRRRNFGGEDFPPLPNQKLESKGEKETPVKEKEKPTFWRNNPETSPKNKPFPPTNDLNKLPNTQQSNHHHSNLPGFHSKDYNPVKKVNQGFNRKINENEIRPFKNDGNKFKNNMRPGKYDDVAKPIRTTPIRHTDPPFPRNSEINRNPPKENDVAQITEGFRHMTFHNKNLRHRDNKPNSNEAIVEENKIIESELDSPANRQNPKRYSKIRKGFTGFFPPEEIAEIDPSELKKLQQQQELQQQRKQQEQQQQQQQAQQQHVNIAQPTMNMPPNVIRRYANSYNGNPGYIPARPIISGMQQQGLSPQNLQQALSPQGIPQQALSPQVPGLQTIELQTTPLPPQPNFVPPPMFIDMDPHYTPDVLGPFTSYPPYSGNQAGEMYQTPSGITYYSTECQSSGQIRPPPARRPKAAIPIVPPPE